MPVVQEITPHSEVTRRGGLSYQFTPKHHGLDRAASQWLPDLTLDQEFAVFDAADFFLVADSGGNLYGILCDKAGDCQFIGTRREQVAEFPAAREGEAWHGYPCFPLKGVPRPEGVVFARMQEEGLITRQQYKRLMGGKYG